jgi:hypothetical protein
MKINNKIQFQLKVIQLIAVCQDVDIHLYILEISFDSE